MIEKDNEERYFLHRAVRTGIYEDPDYPQEIKIAARDAMLSLYDRRVNENDCVYYASRYAELLQMITDEKQTLSDNQTLNLLYTLVNLVSLLHDRGRKNTAWFFDLTQSSTRSLTYTGTAVVYMLLFHAQCSLLMSDYETAYKSAGIAERALAKKFGIRNESTVFLIARANSASTLSPSSWEIVSRSMSTPDLMMTMDMTAPSHASRETPAVRYTIAATSVDAEITESSMASVPEFTSESEFTFSPTPFTYLPSTILTSPATATMISDTVV